MHIVGRQQEGEVIPSLPLLPGQLYPGVVVTLSQMGQIDPLKKLLVFDWAECKKQKPIKKQIHK